MTEHDLKTWPIPFDAVVSGAKRYEYRRDDRVPRFEVGDVLLLRRWDPRTRDYTGRWMRRVVTYITRGPDFGVPRGYCIMSIAPEYDQEPKP